MQQQQQHAQYGVCLRVGGSGWTPPLALDVAEAPGGEAHGDRRMNNLQVRSTGLFWLGLKLVGFSPTPNLMLSV